MQIAPELLSERNYSGNRLILIENEKMTELQAVLDGYQKEINPILDRLNKEYYPVVEPINQEIGKLQAQVRDLKQKITEETEKFRDDMDMIDSLEQKATLVKNKIQPIILKELEGKLGEFEIARYTEIKNGKIYAVVFDELEEKIKEIRANKKK